MTATIFWLYLVNSVLLINHEIESAYWKEWNLFRALFRRGDSPGDDRAGIRGFVLFHLPVVFLLLFGLVEAFRGTPFGRIASLLLCAGGIFAFAIHMFAIRKGHPEFRTALSVAVLAATFVVSLAQAAVTLYAMTR